MMVQTLLLSSKYRDDDDGSNLTSEYVQHNS